MTSADYGLLNNIIQSFWGKAVNLKSIDPGLYEAARIDGAGGFQLFSKITLPLLYPAASFNILMSLIGGLKVFDAMFAMTKGGLGYASETIMTTMIREGFNSGRNAYACAFAVLFFMIVFVITKLVTYFLNRWEERIA